MGYIYEELLRRFSEAHAEAAGDHFTPREVIRLMVELLEIPIPTRHTSIYDPACGTGGMLYVAKEHLLDKATNDDERNRVNKLLTLHGTELLAETYAIARSEALIRGESQTTIHWGTSLIPHNPESKEPGDQFPETAKANHFDYMLNYPDMFGSDSGGVAEDLYNHFLPANVVRIWGRPAAVVSQSQLCSLKNCENETGTCQTSIGWPNEKLFRLLIKR